MLFADCYPAAAVRDETALSRTDTAPMGYFFCLIEVFRRGTTEKKGGFP